MAFIVEDGTGLAAANSYVSVADADAYFLDRGNATWEDADTDVKQAALVRAAAALDGKYGALWPGVRATSAQALDWPRTGAYDRDGYYLELVPKAVKNAACEGALIELESAGALSPVLERGGAVIREKVGSLETEYAVGASAQTAYTAIAQALARIVRSSGIKITRG